MKAGFCRETPGESRPANLADAPDVLEHFLDQHSGLPDDVSAALHSVATSLRDCLSKGHAGGAAASGTPRRRSHARAPHPNKSAPSAPRTPENGRKRARDATPSATLRSSAPGTPAGATARKASAVGKNAAVHLNAPWTPLGKVLAEGEAAQGSGDDAAATPGTAAPGTPIASPSGRANGSSGAEEGSGAAGGAAQNGASGVVDSEGSSPVVHKKKKARKSEGKKSGVGGGAEGGGAPLSARDLVDLTNSAIDLTNSTATPAAALTPKKASKKDRKSKRADAPASAATPAPTTPAAAGDAEVADAEVADAEVAGEGRKKDGKKGKKRSRESSGDAAAETASAEAGSAAAGDAKAGKRVKVVSVDVESSVKIKKSKKKAAREGTDANGSGKPWR